MVSESVETIVGWVAAAIITCLNFPQVYKTYQIRDGSGLAWGMILLNASAGVLWFTYGLLLQKPPIYVANAIYFSASMMLLYMKITFAKIDPAKLDETNPMHEIVVSSYKVEETVEKENATPLAVKEARDAA